MDKAEGSAFRTSHCRSCGLQFISFVIGVACVQLRFAGEDGVDEGGLSREFFQLIVKECFSPKYGMFVDVPGTNVCWFRASALSNLSDELELIGTLVLES
jgi:hypothetical protein